MVSTKYKPGERIYWLLGDKKHYGIVVSFDEAMFSDSRLSGGTPKVWAKWERGDEIGFVYEYDAYSDKTVRNLPEWF